MTLKQIILVVAIAALFALGAYFAFDYVREDSPAMKAGIVGGAIASALIIRMVKNNS